MSGAQEMRLRRTHRKGVSTPERDALLRQLWPDLSIATREVFARLNALPGAPFADLAAVHTRARDLRLFHRMRPQTRARFEQPAKPPVPHPAVAMSLREEAMALFAQGKTVREVAAELDAPIRDVSDWMFAWRESQAGEAA